MNAALTVVLLVLAGAVGVSTSLFGGLMTGVVLAAMLPLPIIFKDYRSGVVLLTLLLPIAPMLPPLRGLNVLNFVTLASLASFYLSQAGQAKPAVDLPRALWLGLLLPATWGILIAWPHIPEGVRNYPAMPDARTTFDPVPYVVARYIKPLFYYFSYAFLLANAVRASLRPERFVTLLAASAMLPALAVFYTVATYPGSLLDVSRDREFMAPRGMHANEFGMLLALATGPMLFTAGMARSRGGRALSWLAFSIVVCALLLTFSRGGLFAFLIVLAGYLLHHKRIKVVVVGAVLVGLVMLAAPASMKERFGTGFRSGALSDASNVDKDDLTAGRVHGWVQLAPEVLDSPWLGRGLGSTQWSTAVAAGKYKANHPHNIYLEILMDTGIIGLCAMAWLHARHLRRFKLLAADPAMPPPMQAFFRGARHAMFGMLAMAATTAYFMPNSAQAYFWFALGVAFAHEGVAQTRPLFVAGRASIARAQHMATPPVRAWSSVLKAR
jgi:O-antigen ligase